MKKNKQIVGREYEQKILMDAYTSPKAEFISVHGRRRVGKTYLIRQYFSSEEFTKKEEIIFFYITGIKDGHLHDQIKNFTVAISESFYFGAPLENQNNWRDTFQMLTAAIKTTSPDKKIVLFMDEFPWMATKKSGLLQNLEQFWNHHWSRDPRIKLIICGSSAGWILKNIVNNQGGLYNRVTRNLHIQPFNLHESEEFLAFMKIKLKPEQIIQLYMVVGGIPFYLSQIQSGLTAVQNIDYLAFKRNGFLFREFSNLYATLFEEPQSYIDLARIISKRPYGIGLEEIVQSIPNMSSGGRVVEWLSNLEHAGFIARQKSFMNKKKGIFYKMTDEYSLFYFHWIEPIIDSILTEGMRAGYWELLQNKPTWSSWAGYAFESLCHKHIAQIAQGLSLQPTALAYAWRYNPAKTCPENGDGLSDRGAQIDLLFDRDDDAITICEIKYTKSPFSIDKKYAEQLNQKLNTFQKVTKTKKMIYLAMICSSGLKKTIYSEDMVSQSINIKSLFAKSPAW